MTVTINPTYINNGLTLKVYEVSDSAYYYEGQIAVTYDEETDVSPEECSEETRNGFAYIGPVHAASGLARTFTIVSYEMRTHADGIPDTETPMKDAMRLIVQDLFED